ncbi:hypothetical protein BZ172_09600 [Shigella sonnei]|uniref:Uncharacterized protein n=1 Tax=Shigella sonnei TaxID=624 RepID=A0AAU8VZ12_SHISO|nr:hypothetical protein BZ172_09600 [Shigella sonnei]
MRSGWQGVFAVRYWATESDVARIQPVFVQGGLCYGVSDQHAGNDSNLLIVFYVQIMPDDFVMQLHRF